MELASRFCANWLLATLLALLTVKHSEEQYQHQEQQQRQEETENGITEEPLVNCGVDSLSMEIRTLRPFSGRLFVKGFSQEQQCQMLGNGSLTQLQFAVHFGQCGLRRSREINGVSVQATVVVSFHPIFITKLDRAYRLNCFYTEARKAVSQQLEVGQLTTSGSINRHGQMPQCRYDILWQNAQGQPIRFARIGDAVFHRWSCHSEQPDTYCMRVHSCTVSDGQGGQAVEVLDRTGCGVDALLLRDLDYTGDLSAGQTASVFKFADKPTLHFNCQIELTLRDQQRACELSKPKCLPPTRPSSGKSPPPAGIKYSKNAEDAYGTQTRMTGTSRASTGSSPAHRPPSTTSPVPVITAPPSAAPSTTQTTGPALLLIKETPLPSAQFRLSPNRSTVKGDELVPFTAPAPADSAYAGRQTQVPPSKLVTEHHPTGESGEKTSSSSSSSSSSEEESAVGDWAQQDAIYQDEVNSHARRRTPQPRSAREGPEKRTARKVADFDLPERSLVVIELDENSLAHQPLIWRLLNSSLPGIQCPSSLATQIPHWTILLVLLFLVVLLSALLWTNWPSRVEIPTGPLGQLQRERREREGVEEELRRRFGQDQHLVDVNCGGPSLRF